MAVGKAAITKDIFDRVHLLAKGGLTPVQIAKATDYKVPSVKNWLKFTTWEDYEVYKKELLVKYFSKKEKASTNGVSEKLPEPTLEHVVKALLQIEMQLSRLADAWERKPENKKFFNL